MRSCERHGVSDRCPSCRASEPRELRPRTFTVDFLSDAANPRVLDGAMATIDYATQPSALHPQPVHHRSPLNSAFDASHTPPPSSTTPAMAPTPLGPAPPPPAPKRRPCCCALCSARWRSAKLRGKPPDIVRDVAGQGLCRKGEMWKLMVDGKLRGATTVGGGGCSSKFCSGTAAPLIGCAGGASTVATSSLIAHHASSAKTATTLRKENFKVHMVLILSKHSHVVPPYVGR